MEQIKMPQQLKSSMVWTSNYCFKHPVKRNHLEKENPIQMMMINGKEVCPRCETDKQTKQLQESIQQEFEDTELKKMYNTLYKQSIVSDPTILKAEFENYLAQEAEEVANKNACMDIVKRYVNGQVFNTFLQGIQGAGKSHLAYSILRVINENNRSVRCLFVSVEEMIRLIKDSFNNKQSKFTEQYFISLLSEVDYLVLDDIGAETGAISTDKIATDFVQRVLYGVMTSRQDKSTIITTNLSSDSLFRMYDKKLVSRMLKKPKYVLFKTTTDKRMSNIPF